MILYNEVLKAYKEYKKQVKVAKEMGWQDGIVDFIRFVKNNIKKK